MVSSRDFSNLNRVTWFLHFSRARLTNLFARLQIISCNVLKPPGITSNISEGMVCLVLDLTCTSIWNWRSVVVFYQNNTDKKPWGLFLLIIFQSNSYKRMYHMTACGKYNADIFTMQTSLPFHRVFWINSLVIMSSVLLLHTLRMMINVFLKAHYFPYDFPGVDISNM